MRLMDPDAWKVEQAPDVIEGVDLLKNHRPLADLITPDCNRKVAAHVVMGNTSYFINTHHVQFSIRTHALIKEYEQYVKSLPTGTKLPLLLPQLVQRLQLSLECLRMPSTCVRMVVGVTTVQREYLELTGLLQYMTKYRPRLDLIDPVDTTQPDDCVGCFTDDPRIAQILWKMVVPFVATDFLEMNLAAGFAPVLATDRLDDHLSLLHRCTENTPWYRNLFAGHVASMAAARGSGVGLAGGQCCSKNGIQGVKRKRAGPQAGPRQVFTL
ncbi:hypothetical protein B0H16DRAFT_1467158 [Mycena metata]|uniref:Uncharacterized protein n=1 Tax=Mycena metata TaxID=1033252 RepID=A0AAD7I695_9AGAR|nr:hypothetical protein B0H16DRAFT_1467158 [Mycena metata]